MLNFWMSYETVRSSAGNAPNHEGARIKYKKLLDKSWTSQGLVEKIRNLYINHKTIKGLV